MSWDADTLLDTLQADIAARLCADAWFDDITILLMQKGVIESDVQNALLTLNEKSGKMGACVVVMPLAVEVPDDDPHTIRMDVLPLIAVFENPLVNRDLDAGGTGKKIYRIALRVLRLFHKWNPGIATTITADKRAVSPFNAPAGSNGMYCNFRGRGALDRPSKVLPVLITGDASAVSLSCNTAEATIYYTTDGSLPWEGTELNPSTATRYGVTMTALDGSVITTLDGTDIEAIAPPFAVEPGTMVRAAAYHPTRQASDAAMAEF